jgi:hypothetical protein
MAMMLLEMLTDALTKVGVEHRLQKHEQRNAVAA